MLGQQAVDDRSNEITAIPVLPERLEPAGALVTSDAIGTRIAVAQTIRARGGGSLLALKADRPRLLAELETVFATPPPEMAIETHQTVDGEHGRIETRRHAVCHPPNRLFADRRPPDEPRFPDLAMIGMVEPETERADGNTDRERRSHLCSARLEAQTFARAVRPRWGIENRLHWVLEVVCRDDLARLRSGHGPANMAVVKPRALNLLQQAKPTTRLNNRRKLAGWRTDYLNPLIRGAA